MINRALLLSHIKITFRNFRKQFGYSFINLTGLALGIAVCLLIFSYTHEQLHFDDFHPDINRLYRVNQTAIWNPEGGMMSSTPPPLAAALKEKIPAVESVLRINTPAGYEVRLDHEQRGLLAYREENVLAADSTFFDFFAIELAKGDRATALAGKNKVVINDLVANKYFGNENSLGKTILMNQIPMLISGVTTALPKNMHFTFDFLLSMASNPNVKQFDWSWIWTQVATYVKLKSAQIPTTLNGQISQELNPQVRSCFGRLGMDYEEFIQDKGTWQFGLQPVRDIHLHSFEEGNRLGTIGDIKTVRILQIIALLILLIAIINFVNLSTARANLRSKEIGVKKTMGALRSSLAAQFQVESIVMTLVAASLSIPLFFALVTLVQSQAAIEIEYKNLLTLSNLLVFLLLVIFIGLLAGIYPAIYLTAFKPVNILSGNQQNSRGPVKLRYFLVASQFAISLALLSGSLLVSKQLKYISKKDLGFERENILVVNHAEDLDQQLNSFRDEVRGLSTVMDASITMDMPGRGSWEDIFMREGSDIKLAISQLKIDPHFFSTMNLKLVEGRSFGDDRKADENAAIINETTARLFGWTPKEALGKKIVYFEMEPKPTIVGVVNDFHFQSLHQDIRPLIFFHTDSPMWGDQRVVAVKYRQDEVQKLINTLGPIWSKFSNGIPFDYSILDEELDNLYRHDQQLSKLINLLTYFSIFIALLGLFGLVSYSTDQRKKEIGIRKVLGASVTSLFVLINKQYLSLLLVGLVISIPFTWYAINLWLQDFAFHIKIPWYLFVLSATLLMFLSVGSVAFLVIRAARANPMEAIRE